jgi:hypothetical protein
MRPKAAMEEMAIKKNPALLNFFKAACPRPGINQPRIKKAIAFIFIFEPA